MAGLRADVVLAHHRDDYYAQMFVRETRELLHEFVPGRTIASWGAEIEVAARLMLLGLSDMFRAQTLGEEYANIEKVDARGAHLALTRRIIALALRVGGPYVLQRGLELARQRLKTCAKDERASALLRRLAVLGERSIPVLEQAVTFSSRLHLALFFIAGSSFHQISHRILGIAHRIRTLTVPAVSGSLSELATISNTPPAIEEAPAGTAHSFKFLGYVICAEMGMSIFQFLIKNWSTLFPQKSAPESAYPQVAGQLQLGPIQAADYEEKPELQEGPKCPLCLSPRGHTAITPCGHLFCWDCIIGWSQSKPECPICRQTVALQKIVRVYNL